MIIAFLGVDSNFLPKPKIVNKNKSIRLHFLYYFIQSPKLKQFFRKKINTRAYFWIKKVTDKIFFKVQEREQIRTELRLQLKEEFRPMVAELNAYLHKEELIKQDLLDLWDYHD